MSPKILCMEVFISRAGGLWDGAFGRWLACEEAQLHEWINWLTESALVWGWETLGTLGSETLEIARRKPGKLPPKGMSCPQPLPLSLSLLPGCLEVDSVLPPHAPCHDAPPHRGPREGAKWSGLKLKGKKLFSLNLSFSAFFQGQTLTGGMW